MQYLRVKCNPTAAHPHLYMLRFSWQHVLAEAAEREKSIVHQLMSLVRNVRWSKYKNTLFLKGASPSLFLDHAAPGTSFCPPETSRKRFFLTGRKKLKHQPPVIFKLLHPYSTEHHRLILVLCLVLSDMTWRGITANCRTVPELRADLDPKIDWLS